MAGTQRNVTFGAALSDKNIQTTLKYERKLLSYELRRRQPWRLAAGMYNPQINTSS